MVPTGDYYPERSYLFAFLLSSRLFIKPHELLEQVSNLCDIQQFGEQLKKFAQQLIQLLTEWIETFPYDFRDERSMQYIRVMTQKCIYIDNGLTRDVSILLQNLIKRLTTLDNYEEFLRQLNQKQQSHSSQTNQQTNSGGSSSSGTITSIDQTDHHHHNNHHNTINLIPEHLLINLNNSDLIELCPSPLEIAQQLTHIELERLYHIGPEEFVQAFAKENKHLKTTFKDIKKTRNLESYVKWFNRLSYLVATEIVKQSKKKQRIHVIEYWIETARECFNIGNFNSLMAIIAGLNMSPILRLKKTVRT